MASALTFLEQYHKDGDAFLNHIIRVTGDETRESQQAKQWMHTHSVNKPKKFERNCLPARKLMKAVFWDRKGVLMVEFMQ
jgi:hypothetical protein